MRKIMNGLVISINLFGIICLIYYGSLFLSGSTIVDMPDAMLPMERWDRGGMALTIGLLPMILANTLGYEVIQLGDRKSRLVLFIPSIICGGLVVAYWGKDLL